jgi:phage gpG-like protein
MGKVNQEQIVADIQAIQELLQKNKNRLSSVSQKLKDANLKIFEMEKTIERLADQIQTKDAQIASLQEQLIKLNGELEYLFNEYNDRVAEVGAKEDELNMAWYAFGTTKELIENGVITKEGGVIGIGKTKKLKEDFNKNYFTKIDIRDVTSIPLQAKSAKVLTNHSSKSYKFEGNGKADKFVITDAKEFWNSSKYLVIVVE